jgi:hypothetical protein
MKAIVFLFFFAFSITNGIAQPYKTIKPFKPYKWMFGVSWSAIDDDGRKFDAPFDYATSWNILPYPNKISVDRYFLYGWSAEASATYNQYLPNKMIQCSTDVTSTFCCFDLNGKYSFYTKYAPRLRWIEPYFSFGIGYTYRSSALVAKHVPTVNLGFGLNFWIIKSLGIQLHSNGKLGVYPGFWDTHTNYLQHSAGLVYRIQSLKQRRSDFSRRKNKWTRENRRFKQRKGH